MNNAVINSKLNNVHSNFDYRKKEITFTQFKSFFDNITFTQTNDGFMGWGEHESSCKTLFVGTASFDGDCFISKVRHATKANNPYNNFVNAITYWDILNNAGKQFFLALYEKEFIMMRYEINDKIHRFKLGIEHQENELIELENEINQLKK